MRWIASRGPGKWRRCVWIGPKNSPAGTIFHWTPHMTSVHHLAPDLGRFPTPDSRQATPSCCHPIWTAAGPADENHTHAAPPRTRAAERQTLPCQHGFCDRYPELDSDGGYDPGEGTAAPRRLTTGICMHIYVCVCVCVYVHMYTHKARHRSPLRCSLHASKSSTTLTFTPTTRRWRIALRARRTSDWSSLLRPSSPRCSPRDIE